MYVGTHLFVNDFEYWKNTSSVFYTIHNAMTEHMTHLKSLIWIIHIVSITFLSANQGLANFFC